MKLNLRGHVADKSVDLGMDAAHTGGMGGGKKKQQQMKRRQQRWGGGAGGGGVGGENNGFPILHPTLCSLRGGKRVFLMF